MTVWIKTFLFKENVANSDFRLQWLSNCHCNSSKINVGIGLTNRRTMTVTGAAVVLDETCDINTMLLFGTPQKEYGKMMISADGLP